MHRALAALLLFPLAATAYGQFPPRSISTPKEEVDDEFIAYLHGVLYSDVEIRVDGDTLAREFPEFVPSQPTPFNDIQLFVRTRSPLGVRGAAAGDAAGPGQLSVQFSVPLRYEVPVDILGHHPVELQGSRVITFQETIRPGSAAAAVAIPPEVSDLLVLTLVSGYMRVDFAPWLDFISGRILEDVDVALIAVARYRGRWFALLGGRNDDDRPMTGVFDMRTSRFLMRPPRLLTRLARDLILDTQ